MGRRAVRAALACACAWATGVAGGGSASAGPGVVVVPAAHAPATMDDTARAMAAALGDGAVADALAAARRARVGGAVPAERLRGFARAARLVAEGWRAYLAVDGPRAAERLAAARAEAEPLLALDGGLELYADLELRRGLVLTALGRVDEGAALLRLAHALDPARSPSESEFSPDALAAYAAAVAAAPARHEVELRVPRGARVAIDGVEVPARRGLATVELTAGPHVVVVRAPGALPTVRVIDARGGAAGPVEVAGAVDPAAVLDGDAALAPGMAAAAASRAVEQVMAHAEVDALYLVASVRRGGQPALLGQRCGAAGPACTAVVEVGYVDGAGLDGAARVLGERLAVAPLRGAVSLTGDERLRGGRGGGDGGGRRRWIVAGAGVLAVAAIVTVVVLASGDEPLPVVTIDPGDFGR